MKEGESSDITAFLQAVNEGKPGATEDLFRVVYDELRRVAHGWMAREAPGNTLQTTALANEAYLRMIKSGNLHWENRRHFFGSAARAMRQILIDRARSKNAARHGGGARKVELDDNVAAGAVSEDLLALDEALDHLAAEFPRQAKVVTYRYFLGLTVDQTADLLEVSARTVNNDWELAKARLRRDMTG